MTNAKQCDRCKNFYPLNSVSHYYKIKRIGTLYDDNLDLCDKCYSDLLKFIGVDSEKKKGKKNGCKKV